MDASEISNPTIDAAMIALRYHKSLADKAIAQISDQQLHQALDGNTNCIAVIMQHVAGNLLSRWTDFLTTDGEKPWRNRDQEFFDALKSRKELLADWNSSWQRLFDSLSRLTLDDLSKTVMTRGEAQSVPLAIARSLGHTCYHVGQIVLIARIMAGDHWTTLTIPRGESASFNQRMWGVGGYT